MEEYLSRKESEYSKIFKKIIKNIEDYYYESKEIERIKHNEKRIILEFIYYQLLRVPKYINNLIENGKEFLIELNKKYKHTQTEKEIINELKLLMLPRLFDGVEKFISIVIKRNWAFLIIGKNINNCFISTDNPIVITNHTIDAKKVGIIDPMTEISVPISKNIILTIRETYIENRIEYHIIDSIEKINEMNKIIMKNAFRFVYSNDIIKLKPKNY